MSLKMCCRGSHHQCSYSSDYHMCPEAASSWIQNMEPTLLTKQGRNLVSSSCLGFGFPSPKGNGSVGSSSVAMVSLNAVRYYNSDIRPDLDPEENTQDFICTEADPVLRSSKGTICSNFM